MKRWLWIACAAVVAGCTQDSPLSVGENLLPGEAIRTFEVTLEPQQYLVLDTAFGLYGEPEQKNYVIMARQYGGALNARALVRYTIPRNITVRTAGDTLRIDSLGTIVGGSIRLLVDTIGSTPGVTAEVFRSMERWDRETATWTHRVDSAGARIAWQTPGGSPGPQISTGVLRGDTLVLPIDTATIRALRDTTGANDGLLLGVATPGGRIRAVLPSLTVRVRSSRADTTVETIVAPVRTFIFEPALGRASSDLRVGGVQEWRSILRLKERIDTVTVPCPDKPGCRLKLSELALNAALLQLQPVIGPAGLDPEVPVYVAVHAVLADSRLPLERSPLTEAVSINRAPIPMSSFLSPNAPIVELPISTVLALIIAGAAGDKFVPTYLALLPGGGSPHFGVATFAALPRLRLVVSLARELRLP